MSGSDDGRRPGRLRNDNVRRLAREAFDVLVVGGGINGAVSAAALAARGAKVALIDARDFAGFTSGQSSNLVWGGIKYMESYEFGLVAELCKSRNELIRRFPSTVREVRFLAAVSRDAGLLHSPVALWAGTWLYWLFGRGFTRTPSLLGARGVKAREPAVDVSSCRGGVEYSDAYLHDNDARFVFGFVRGALDNGCVAANYVASAGASRDGAGGWITRVRDEVSGKAFEIRSKILVNAAGAFVDEHNALSGITTEYRHVLSKGIHLIVPRVTDSGRVLTFFADDGRLFFAIPMAHRTCIGTTDTRVSEPVTGVTDEDREFVLSNINSRLSMERPLTRDDVIAERCGVRPLAVRQGDDTASDFLQLSRKHVVEVSRDNAHISIFGGKLTDCVNVGEEICERALELGLDLSVDRPRWYGEPDPGVYRDYASRAAALGLDDESASDTRESLSARLWRRYGADAIGMLDRIEADRALTRPVIEGSGIRRCELDYLAEREMIVRLEDLLRRRSKLELVMRREDLETSAGLRDVCRVLFGDEADTRYREYFDQVDAGAGQRGLNVGTVAS